MYIEEYLSTYNRVTELLGLEAKVNMISNILANMRRLGRIAHCGIFQAKVFLTVAQSNAYRKIAEQIRVAAPADLKLYMTHEFAL